MYIFFLAFRKSKVLFHLNFRETTKNEISVGLSTWEGNIDDKAQIQLGAAQDPIQLGVKQIINMHRTGKVFFV